MTDEQRIAAIEARANAATPGPWKWEDWNRAGDAVDDPTGYTLAAPPEARPGGPSKRWPNLGQAVASLEDSSEITDEDRRFLAHIRDDVPFLLAALRDRDRRIAELEMDLEQSLADRCKEEDECAQAERERDEARRVAIDAVAMLRDRVNNAVLQKPRVDELGDAIQPWLPTLEEVRGIFAASLSRPEPSPKCDSCASLGFVHCTCERDA